MARPLRPNSPPPLRDRRATKKNLRLPLGLVVSKVLKFRVIAPFIRTKYKFTFQVYILVLKIICTVCAENFVGRRGETIYQKVFNLAVNPCLRTSNQDPETLNRARQKNLNI